MSSEKKTRYKKKKGKTSPPTTNTETDNNNNNNILSFTLPVITQQDLDEEDDLLKVKVSFDEDLPRQDIFPNPETSEVVVTPKPVIEAKTRVSQIPKQHKYKDSGAFYSKIEAGPYSVPDAVFQTQNPSHLEEARKYIQGQRSLQRTNIEQNEAATRELVMTVLDAASSVVSLMQNNPYYKFASEVGTLIHGRANKFIQSSAVKVLDLLKLDTLHTQKDLEKSLLTLSSSLGQVISVFKAQMQISPMTSSSSSSSFDNSGRSNLRLDFLVDQESALMRYYNMIQDNIFFLNTFLKQGSILATRKFFLSDELIVMAEKAFNNVKNWRQNTRSNPVVDQNIIDLDINVLIRDCPSSRLVLAEYISYDYQQQQRIKGYRPTTRYQSAEIVEKLEDVQNNLILRLREELQGQQLASTFSPVVFNQIPVPSPISVPAPSIVQPSRSSSLLEIAVAGQSRSPLSLSSSSSSSSSSNLNPFI